MSDIDQISDKRETVVDQESQESSLNLRHYWHIVLERRWLVVATFLGIFALSIIYLVRATPIYTAVTRLQIDRPEAGAIDSGSQLVLQGNHNEYLQTMYKRLLSRSLIEMVLNELQLLEDDRYKRAIDKIRALSNDITIKPLRLTYLVDIEVDHPNNEMASNIANSLADNFLQANIALSDTKSQVGIQKLDEELNILQKEAEQDEQAYLDYAKNVEGGGASLDKQMDVVILAYTQASNDLSAAETQEQIAKSLAQEAERYLQEGKDLTSIPAIASDPVVLTLKKELATKQSILAGLLARYKSKHPSVISAREEIQSITISILEKSKEVYRSLQADAQLASNKVKNFKAILSAKEQRQIELQQARVQYDFLKRKADQSWDLYQKVLSEKEIKRINRNYKENNISVVDRATPPGTPSKPRKSLILLMGVVGGLAAGVGLAFFVNFLDDSVKTQEDVENVLKLQFLGYIPNIKTNSLVERDLQSHLHPQSTAAEAFRTLRTTVSLMPKADDLNVISMTSTIPSEGKSLVASNLAIVMAQTGMKTVLVDADLRRPSVHKAFQLHSPVGLAAYLKREANTIDEIVHKSEVPDLDIICCGGIPGSPSELVSSSRMFQFIEELRQKYDKVVIDCPPVSAVSDPLVIAARTDGVIFVNKFNRIRREHARRTIQRIQDAGVRILGAAINDIDFEGKDSYYYSYYYYQNRYYASHYSDGDSSESSSKKKAS